MLCRMPNVHNTITRFVIKLHRRALIQFFKAAALDCCWGTDQNRCFSGGVDKCVKTYDFASETESVSSDMEFIDFL